MRRAAPVYAGLAIVVAVLFGPTGISPATVTSSAASSPAFSIGLWVLWLALITPALRAPFLAPGATYLRSLPIPVLAWWSLLVALALSLQFPWIVLWALGSGPAQALGAASMCGAMAIFIGVRPRTTIEAVLELVCLGALMTFVITQPDHLWFVAGVPTFVGAVIVGWSRAPEHSAGRGLRVHPRATHSPLFALTATHLAMLARERRAAVVRALMLAGLGGALAGAFARSNQVAGSGFASLVLAVGAVTLAIAAGAIAAPILESERRARWMLDSAGASGELRVVASTVAVAVVLAGLGAAHGACAAWVTGGDAAELVRATGGAVVLAIGLGAIALRGARFAELRGGIDGSRVVAVMVGAAVISLIAIGWQGELGLVVVVSVAVVATASGRKLAAAPHQRWQRRRNRA